jgi:hypothetical protein
MTSVIESAVLAIGRGNRRYEGYRMFTGIEWEDPKNRTAIINSYVSGWKALEDLTLSQHLCLRTGIPPRFDNYVIREVDFNYNNSLKKGEIYVMANHLLRYYSDPTTKFSAPYNLWDDHNLTDRPCLFIYDPNYVHINTVFVGKGNAEYIGFRKVTPDDFKKENMVNEMMRNYYANERKWSTLEPLQLTSDTPLCIEGAVLVFSVSNDKIVSLPESKEPVIYYSPHLLNTDSSDTEPFNHQCVRHYYFKCIPHHSNDGPCLFVPI